MHVKIYTFWLKVLISLNRIVKLLLRYGNLKSDPEAPMLSERVYIRRCNPLFIRQHAQLIMCTNENICVSHQGYLTFSAWRFLFAGHIPSSFGVILRTTEKIVWANEFERKLLEDHSNLFSQSSFSFCWFRRRPAALTLSVSFTAIELTCLIESISTNNPRIEWKKIKNGIPSYVYFQNKIAGKALPFFFLTASAS